MAFSAFANRLPDPNYKITEAGENSNSGTAGPGFASVKFTANQPVSFSNYLHLHFSTLEIKPLSL